MASETFRAAVLTAAENLEIQIFERPVVGPRDGLLLVEANGICGTDVHFFRSNKNTPRILGHEVVGRIAEVGDDAAKIWNVKVGDRVAVEAGIGCGVCRECLTGNTSGCRAVRNYGSDITLDNAPALWGGCAQAMFLGAGTVLTIIPESVPADVAAGWFSPMANGVDWTGPEAGNVRPGQYVVIIGPGPQGLATSVAAKARGARRVILAGLTADGNRLRAGLTLGADRVVTVDTESLHDIVASETDGEMADVVIDISGSVAAASTTADLVRRRGTVVAASPIQATEPVLLPLGDMISRQIRWQGVLSNAPMYSPLAAQLLEENVEQLAPLITHRFGLEGIDEAIAIAAGQRPGSEAIKMVILPQGVPA